MPDKISQLQKSWVQGAISYSKGFSLLVHRQLRWEVGQVTKDPEGRFIFTRVWIDSQPYVIFGNYFLPIQTCRFTIRQFDFPLNSPMHGFKFVDRLSFRQIP